MPGKTREVLDWQDSIDSASMRPQRNAGENIAANLQASKMGSASMRPQRNAGENPSRCADSVLGEAGFNEAPAKCRGKPAQPKASPWTCCGFNEAPAKCRGKPQARGSGLLGQCASMRPQRNAGENGMLPDARQLRFAASMRPQRNAGENASFRRVMGGFLSASMRPQRNAGENGMTDAGFAEYAARFNEAPAKCRGKRKTIFVSRRRAVALQ